MSRLRDFWLVYRMYARCHPPLYAARIAYGIAFQKLPF